MLKHHVCQMPQPVDNPTYIVPIVPLVCTTTVHADTLTGRVGISDGDTLTVLVWDAAARNERSGGLIGRSWPNYAG
jgi:hypothetical protein